VTSLRAAGSRPAPALEARLRRALAWYPREWRERHGEAALGVLLDVAEADGAGRLALAQRLDLAFNGLAERLVGWVPRQLRTLAASAAFLGATGFALVHFAFFEWEPWARPDGPAWLYWHPFTTPAAWLDLAWLLGAVLFLCGWRRVSRGVCVLAGAGAVALLAIHYALPGYWPFATTLAVYAVAGAFAAVGEPWRPAHSGLTALAGVGSAAAVALAIRAFTFNYPLVHAYRTSDLSIWLMSPSGRVEAVAALGAVCGAIALAAVLRRRALALRGAALALPWVVLWSIHLIHDGFLFGGGGFDDGLHPVRVSAMRWALALGLAIAAAIGLGILRARLLSHPSPAPSPDHQEPLHG